MKKYKILSVIFALLGAGIYAAAFNILFAAIFHGATPSLAIILINLILSLIVILLIPIFSEFLAAAKSLLVQEKIDTLYILKQLNKISPKSLNLQDLANFLSAHLHTNYVAIVVKGQITESDHRNRKKLPTPTSKTSTSEELPTSTFTPEELAQIAALDYVGREIWQKPTPELKAVFNRENITGVAELHNTSDEEIGQLIIGAPKKRLVYTRLETLQMETVISALGLLISSAKRLNTKKPSKSHKSPKTINSKPSKSTKSPKSKTTNSKTSGTPKK